MGPTQKINLKPKDDLSRSKKKNLLLGFLFYNFFFWHSVVKLKKKKKISKKHILNKETQFLDVEEATRFFV